MNPSDKVTILFCYGPKNSEEYDVIGMSEAWNLVKCSHAEDDRVVISVSVCGQEKFIGAGLNNNYCIFTDNHDYTITFPYGKNSTDGNETKVQFTDNRWDMVYYIPKCLMKNIDEIENISRSIIHDLPSNITTIENSP
jgi:hypothetical protein